MPASRNRLIGFMAGATPRFPPAVADTLAEWRPLTILCRYRVVVAVILGIFYWGMQRQALFEPGLVTTALWALSCLFLASLLLLAAAQLRIPTPAIHLTLQVIVDVAAIGTLTFAAGGVRSGIGLLLLVSIAASAIVSRGRIALFHAAIAALAMLFQQSWRFVFYDALIAEFVQTGLLAGSYFLVAAITYTLAKYAEGAERVAAERSVDLANLAQINELVIRDMQDGFIVVDEDGRIRQRNVQSEQLVGSRSGALSGTLAECSPQLAAALETWRLDASRNSVLLRESASSRELEVRFVAIGEPRADGRPAPTVIFLADATRVRAQAQQLKLAALGRLTASIAHEIRNPLSSINHAAELLQEDAERSARGEEETRLLTIIRDNAFRLDRMVQEVLYLSRRERTHPEDIPLRAYLTTFCAEFCGNERIAPDALTLGEGEEVGARMDKSHLNQILWNLAHNAMRHGRPGQARARLAVFSDARRHTACIEVTDNGTGVAEDALPHLFEPFFTTQSTGTGLGLYIARELAEVNGARLEHVGSGVPPWSGASFRLELPLSSQPPFGAGT
jgi:two-component system sensor histidine kinase PilS (NtrC family)